MTQYKLPGYQTPVIKHSKPHLTTKKPYATKKENGPPVPKSSYQPPGYKEAEKKKEEKNKRPTSPAGAAPFKTQSGMSFHRFFFSIDLALIRIVSRNSLGVFIAHALFLICMMLTL